MNRTPERSINLFHCLNELGDDSLMQEIQDYLKSGKIRETKLSSSQWSALVYVLLTSEQRMDVFKLKLFIGSQNTADEVLQKLLPVVKESKLVQLMDCGVTDEGCGALASALKSNPSHMRNMNLSLNKLGASGVKLLSDGLKDPHCKLEKLRRKVFLKSLNVRINTNNLRVLQLGRKGGRSVLFWARLRMQTQKSVIVLHRLGKCGVTDEGCAALASALRSDPSHLRELDLSLNKLGDSGLNLLSDGLKDPHCKLETLRLSDCGVTDEGCAALASALRSNPSHLRELDLSMNKFRASGLNLLSDLLKTTPCKLEILRLSYCGVTEECCASLASALRSNPSHLKELDLSGNELGASELNLLSAGLKDSLCKLEILRYDCINVSWKVPVIML
uniref:NACHT LRR and PYD domain-containing protein n=1 Tax=Sinocyclocheilus rhinocerous TaxID=307959 RepID=A0A673H9M4_9TELE